MRLPCIRTETQENFLYYFSYKTVRSVRTFLCHFSIHICTSDSVKMGGYESIVTFILEIQQMRMYIF